MSKHIKPDPIWFKNQRVWRTLFSGALALLTVLPVAFGIIGDQWPAELWTVAAAQILAVQAVVTRIMAIDQVNSWLTKLGLGSTPPITGGE